MWCVCFCATTAAEPQQAQRALLRWLMHRNDSGQHDRTCGGGSSRKRVTSSGCIGCKARTLWCGSSGGSNTAVNAREASFYAATTITLQSQSTAQPRNMDMLPMPRTAHTQQQAQDGPQSVQVATAAAPLDSLLVACYYGASPLQSMRPRRPWRLASGGRCRPGHRSAPVHAASAPSPEPFHGTLMQVELFPP